MTLTAGQVRRLTKAAKTPAGRVIPAGAMVRLDRRAVRGWWECTVAPYDQAILPEQVLEDAELAG